MKNLKAFLLSHKYTPARINDLYYPQTTIAINCRIDSMEQHRIGWLDSFRALAVLSVMLYHLTNPFTAHYPHSDFFLHFFKYGFLGVNFFFMISGFVISFTLERTPNLYSFHVSRFARLFPAMLLCSLIILVFAILLDWPPQFPNAHIARNLLPGLTFINPQLWSLACVKSFHWLNGSFWSLWTEVQFYLLSSIIYFLNRTHFFRNMLLAGVILATLKYIPQYGLNQQAELVKHLGIQSFLKGWIFTNECFNISFYITWFLLGVIFFRLYKGVARRSVYLLVFSFIVVMGCLLRDSFNFFTSVFTPLAWGTCLMCGLFVLMIFSAKARYAVSFRLPKRLGQISYSLYLIHEVVGLVLINRFCPYLGRYSYMAPFLAMIIFIGFAEVSFRLYEKRVGVWIKKVLT